MLYVPIIKLKKTELLKANYVSEPLHHPNIIPFLELRYDPFDTKKNCDLKTFTSKTGINKFFLGIPHKKQAVKITSKSKDDNYIVQANSTTIHYFDKSLELFDIEGAIPVFYIYNNEDVEFLDDFIEYARPIKRNFAVITTPRIALNIDKTKLLKNDYLFIDLEDKLIKAQSVNLEKISRANNCNIILVRENRQNDTFNTSIELDEEAPLLNDLSTEFDEVLNQDKKVRIDGFGDYCGQKNSVDTSGGGSSKNPKYPAVAMYMKERNPAVFIGIKSENDISNGGFQNLKQLVKDRLNVLDPNNKTPLVEILNNEPCGGYSAWHIIEEWYYISKMSTNDSWKDVVIKVY